MLVIQRLLRKSTNIEEVFIEVPPSDKPTHIRICVVQVRGTKIRLGFEAPKEVTINRAELQQAITGFYEPMKGFEPEKDLKGGVG